MKRRLILTVLPLALVAGVSVPSFAAPVTAHDQEICVATSPDDKGGDHWHGYCVDLWLPR